MNLPYAQADELLSRMTNEQKIGQMIMASIEVTSMDDKTRDFLRKNHVGNIILFGKNCENRAQLAKLNQQIQDEVTAYTGGVQAILSIDQEGGRVTRIRNGATVFPCAMAIGATGDPENAYLMGHIMGNEMRALGISFDLAPVLDLNLDNNDPVVGSRSFGETPAETSLYGGAFARGLRDAGVIDCGKHFPGHGNTREDTHFVRAVSGSTAEEVVNEYVAPFRKVIEEGMRGLMTIHVCYPSLDPDNVPATMSKPILQDLLRKKLGYEGLVISDGMQMLAIADHYGAPQGCVRAAKAGCDLLIVGNGGDNADPDGADVQTPCVKALLQALESGELPMERVNDSVRRILAFKLMLGDLQPAADVAQRDWRAHEAFAAALAEMSVTVHRDDDQLLPLPKGALFMSRVSRARLGVEEGDHLVDGFAPMAARLMDGNAIEFDDQPDVDALAQDIAAAPAVVFAVANVRECMELLPAMEAVHKLNPRFCFVCLDAPYIVKRVPFAPCAISSYDQTVHAIRAVCKAMKG